MKQNIIIGILSLALGIMILPFMASAQGVGSVKTNLDSAAGDKGAGFNTGVSTGATDVATTLGNVIKVFIGLIGGIATLYIVYGGFIWVTAGGNDDKVQKAQKHIKNAALGLIVASLAYVIVSLVISLATPTT